MTDPRAPPFSLSLSLSLYQIGCARNRGIDILANEVSNLATPSLVSFTPRQRLIGESAKTAETSNFKNTVGSLKRIIGRSFNDVEFQEHDRKFINAELEEVNGQIAVKVNYLGEPATFTATQLMAAYLAKLRDTAAAELKAAVSDVVISVPGWFTDVQRRAMLDASEVAGLNSLRLINDTTATALGYGITKSDLPETTEEARNVVFVDVGHSNYQVAVVAFSKGQLQVKATAFDKNFGGRDFDWALIQHFAQEFKTKYKIDVMSSPKAIFRLTTGCERLKKVLSANNEAPLNVESLMNDIDATSSLNRETFEKLTSHLLDRVPIPLEAALKDAGLTIDQIHSVEIVGGSTRVPAIKERISQFFGGKALSFTLNQEEAICRGATFACASLSPVFRVRDFAIHDINPYPVKVTWELEAGNPDEETELVVFPRGNAIPSTKILTFHRGGPFELEAMYAEDADISKGVNPWLGKVAIKGVTKTESGDLSMVKVKTRMNLHGILNFEEAYMVEEVEEDEKYTEGEGEDKKELTRKIRKLRRKGACPIVGSYTGLDEKDLNLCREAEGEMHSSDKLVMETENMKNALEEYVYDMRNKLDGKYKLFATAEEKEKLLAGLTDAEDWLYTEEGEDATKSAYVAKLDALKQTGNAIAHRWSENEERPRAAAQLREATNHYMSLAQGNDEKYSHISEADRTKVIEKAATEAKWLEDNLVRQSERPKNVDPIIKSADILKRKEDVTYSSNIIFNQPKPKVTTTDSQTATPNNEKADESKTEGDKGPEPEIQEMDVD